MQTESMMEMETSSAPFKRKEGSIDTSEYDHKDRPPYTFFENEPLKAIVYLKIGIKLLLCVILVNLSSQEHLLALLPAQTS